MSFCYIVRYSRAHTCMRSAFLTDKIDLYPQCVFSCDCSSSPASAAFGLDSVVVRGKNRFERFLLFTLLMPEHEWISPRTFMHSLFSFKLDTSTIQMFQYSRKEREIAFGKSCRIFRREHPVESFRQRERERERESRHFGQLQFSSLYFELENRNSG